MVLFKARGSLCVQTMGDRVDFKLLARLRRNFFEILQRTINNIQEDERRNA